MAQPPPNDTCPGIAFYSLPFTYSGNTTQASNNYSNCVGSSTRDVVFTMSLQDPVCRNVTVSLCSGSGYNTGLTVRTGGSCPGDTLVACNDNFCGPGGLASQLSFVAIVGVTYYVIVHGGESGGALFGNYSLSVTSSGSPYTPPNDRCPGTSITSVPYADSGNTACATYDYVRCGGNTPDVVYNMNLATCQNVTVSLCGSSYSTALAVFTGGSCPGNTQVACNEHYCGPQDRQSQVTFAALANTSYYITVHGGLSQPQSGHYVLNVTGTQYIPPNDTCPGTPITGLPYTITGNTACDVHAYAHCLGGTSPDEVYTITLPCSTLVAASLCGSQFNTGIEVRVGGSCPGDQLVACNDDNLCEGSPTNQSTAVFTARPDVNYYVLIFGAGSASGSYTLNVTGSPLEPVPANDQCPGTAITSLPFTDQGSTCHAGNDYFNCAAWWTPEVVYTLNIPSCQTVTASLCGSNFSTVLGVRTGGNCPGNSVISCTEDSCNQASFVATANVTYYIVINGVTGTGHYVLSVTGVPWAQSNDTCPGTTIPSLPYTDTGNTICANYEGYPHCSNVGTGDVVYNLTLDSCRWVHASLCGSTYYDSWLDVRYGGNCPGEKSAACSYADFCSLEMLEASTANFHALAGVTYYIIVEGWGDAGPYQFHATDLGPYVPPNDACPGTAITSLPYTDMGNTSCAAQDYPSCIEGRGAPDVMYSLTLSSCQRVTASLCGSGYDTGLGVATDGACPGSTLVACNDDYCGSRSQVTFLALANVTYFIRVDGWHGASGMYVLNVTGTPSALNDTCPGTSITSLPYSDSGDTRCATYEGYQHCQGFNTAQDVVYTLNLPACQTVTASLCNSGYDTYLDVRVGGECPGTTLVACNDDAVCNGASTTQSVVNFDAIAGVGYYIIVHGFNTSAGPFVLNVTGTLRTVPNDTCPGTSITSLPYADTSDTRCANYEGYPHCGSYSARDVLYNLNLPTGHNVTVSLCNSGYDTRLDVRTVGSCPGDSLVACDDDYCAGWGPSQVTFTAQPAIAYFIVVHGWGVEAGPIVLNVTGTSLVPYNDVCPGRMIPFWGWDYTDSGSTVYADNDYVNCVGPASHDVVYTLVNTPGIPECRTVTVSLCGSEYNTGLGVRTGGDCPGDTLVACNDDGCGLQSQLTFRALPQNYYIIVHGQDMEAGAYRFHLTQQPCAPDSLVVKSVWPDIQLFWNAVPWATSYKVYRATTSDVQPVPGNLWDTSPTNSYVDTGVLGTGVSKYFYAVTAVYSGALLTSPADRNPDGMGASGR